jgi:poly-beta-1,6-N-acetyl-D-glucosamine N-deacetylase
VWISFDDGWKSNITDVLPVLIEKKVPASFFISTWPVESSGVFWWSMAEKNMEMLPQKFKDNFDLLWKVPEAERKEALKALDAKIKDDEREAMTVEDVKKMAEYDFITIGSHTVNHVITVNCTAEELEYELTESKNKLEQWTGKTISMFSFPNGDYKERDIEMLIKTGYKSAVVVENRAATANDNIYKIPRFSVGNATFAEELCHMLGVWQKVISKIK